MDFLRNRVRELTTHHVEIIRTSNFLHGLGTNPSQNSKERIENFELKWHDSKYFKSLVVGYIIGSWAPVATADTLEVAGQKEWSKYLKDSFNISFSGPPCSGDISHAFTFEAMVQHEFWKDVYNTFGQKVASFIFEKTLVFIEIDDDFFLMIASPKCNLYSKISSVRVIPTKRNAAGGPPFKASACFNPYFLKCVDGHHSKPNLKPATNNRKRSASDVMEVCPDDNEELPICPPTKKVKTSTAMELVDPAALQIVPMDTDVAHIAKSVGDGVIRWFQPNPATLKFLVDERENQKRKTGVAIKSYPEDSLVQLHFVCIMETSKMSYPKLILKQFKSVDFKKLKLIPEWKGLQIKEPEPPSQDRKYNVNVYRISEEFARRHNIRVKVKRRRGRKPQKNQDDNQNDNDGGADSGNGMEVVLYNPAVNDIPVLPSPTRDNEIPLSDLTEFTSGLPYDPCIPMVTSPVLYNKSSWSRWPKNHVFSTLSSADDVPEAVQILLNELLGTNVGATSFVNNNAKVELFERGCKLNDMLAFIVRFRKRVKDMHSLVKRCLTRWIIKLEQKKISKAHKSLKRKEWRLQHPRLRRKRGRSTTPANRSKSVEHEVIDLTVDTPSTASTATPDLSISRVNETLFCTPLDTTSTSEMKLSNESSLPTYETLRPVAYKKLKEKIPHSCVMMTLKNIMYLSGFEKILGSRKNARNFYRFMRKSLVLAGTKSSLQFGELMSQIELKGCDWIPQKVAFATKICLLAKFTKWIFSNFILTVLKTSFYITETNASRLHTCFYLRESWKSISESVRRRLVESGTLNHAGLLPGRHPQPQQGRTAGSKSTIRFLPKRNHDLRPIITLGQHGTDRYAAENAKLIIEHYVKRNSSHRLRDPNVLKQRWTKFLHEWKSMNKPKLYFARVDVQDAYPSVDTQKLKGILDNIGKDLGEIICKKTFRVITKTRIYYRRAIISWNQPSVWYSSICARPCIVHLENWKNSSILKPKEVFHSLFPFVNNHSLRIGKNNYSLQRGLPQGWKLSEDYCNAYYGAMDHKYLSRYMNKTGEFFLTSVDDYLYLTYNPRMAAHFLDKMKKGFPDFRCNVNTGKVFTNIYPSSTTPAPLQSCEWVNFCGWCFCIVCGHIMRDFSSYAGQDMTSSITFMPTNVTSPENFLIARMKTMLAVRFHQFMVDPFINCRARIVLNIWEAGLVFAFRYYAICRVMYPSLNALKDPVRVKQNIAAIIVCARTFTRLAMNNCKLTSRDMSNNKPICSNEQGACLCIQSFKILQLDKHKLSEYDFARNEALTEPEILYIVYHAFVTKLRRHHSVFESEVLPRLRKVRKMQKLKLSKESSDYIDALLGNQLPLHFRNIKA